MKYLEGWGINKKDVITTLESAIKVLEEGIRNSRKRSAKAHILARLFHLIGPSPGLFLDSSIREPAIRGFISAYSILRDIHAKILPEKELEHVYNQLNELLISKADPVVEAIKRGKEKETMIMKVEDFLDSLKQLLNDLKA